MKVAESMDSLDRESSGEVAKPATPLRQNVVTVERTELPESSVVRQRATWIIDSRKLSTKDKQVVSPEFQLEVFNGEVQPFKLSLYPTAKGTARGHAGFRKSKGCGRVELKCLNQSAEATEEELMPTLFCSFGVGALPVRGPVQHDFSQRNTCSLDKEFEEWNFNAAVDDSNTLVVFVEVDVHTA